WVSRSTRCSRSSRTCSCGTTRGSSSGAASAAARGCDVQVVLLGPPGVGKGTQGRRLASDRGWALISTGDMLRDAIAKRTSLGLEAGKLMDQGFLVPDPVMIGLVRERTLERDAETGFVLDGFPRTVAQAQALDAILAERALPLDVVVALTAPDQ